jgi:hypothetical protein
VRWQHTSEWSPTWRCCARTVDGLANASAAALVCEAFETELVGGELTGMCPHRSVDGALWFRQLWEVTAAHKA